MCEFTHYFLLNKNQACKIKKEEYFLKFQSQKFNFNRWNAFLFFFKSHWSILKKSHKNLFFQRKNHSSAKVWNEQMKKFFCGKWTKSRQLSPTSKSSAQICFTCLKNTSDWKAEMEVISIKLKWKKWRVLEKEGEMK